MARGLYLHLWIAVNGPWLLWLTGAFIFILGLVFGNDAAITIGGVALIGGILLPRLRGDFKLGPQGIEGSLNDDFLDQVARAGQRRGLPPAKVDELVVEARAELPSSPETLQLISGTQDQSIPALMHRVATDLAEGFVEGAVAFDDAVQEAVRQVSEDGWEVLRNPENPHGAAHRADFLLTRDSLRVIVEAFYTRNPTITRSPSGPLGTAAFRAAALLSDYEADRALLVVPAGVGYSIDAPRGVKILTPPEIVDEIHGVDVGRPAAP
jgi:hypothetical protein